MATQEQVKVFFNKLAPIAVDQARKHGYKIFPSVCLAQAACESAYGTSPKMIRANAVFGIKVGKSKYHFGTAWKDKAYSTTTKECYDGKTYTAITDLFRAYDTLEEAVEDYYDLLCVANRYKYALNQPTPLACIQGIQRAPYATSPTYVSTIMNIINKYGLTKYDNKEISLNPYKLTATVMRFGSRGESVKWVQYQLNKAGYSLARDGIFGQKTREAVKDFQLKRGLLVDGIVGKNTLIELSAV